MTLKQCDSCLKTGNPETIHVHLYPNHNITKDVCSVCREAFKALKDDFEKDVRILFHIREGYL